MRLSTNTVGAVLDLYQRDLGGRLSPGEVRAIAEAVFHHLLAWDRTRLIAERDATLSESELLRVYLPLKRLRSGEPLQYILGSTSFHGLTIEVGPAVLIPRPETEELVDLIKRSGQAPARIVDVGTGSGCIALALKRHFPLAEVHGLDVSDAALEVARRNAILNGLQVRWGRTDVLDDRCMLPAGTDLVVSNPPYIPRIEAPSLDPHVRDHEPALALFVDDEDPIRFHKAIGQRAMEALVHGGTLWFEGHHRTIGDVPAVLRTMGYQEATLLHDLSGAPRFVRAVR
ncbi:MAG: peptide chain release factor N(5)-glutamine methyltransferase [Flavobacteriales bacterium]|nr:peptide chain release factor N(5)-glutamine methyltransferase [Flavobacteriales bacterium]MBK7941570.1 peptide chain release factor N(5)-glutamine methyltransferase [Flavobacteriales bacterium]MBK9700114.1 peptide chain release factor N(5)-glutamine methyltransferase [Flavobacteriales bacterium]